MINKYASNEYASCRMGLWAPLLTWEKKTLAEAAAKRNNYAGENDARRRGTPSDRTAAHTGI
jgi:hypothetical protein